MKYKIFTLIELIELVNEQVEKTKGRPCDGSYVGVREDPVYAALFAGLDAKMLSMMCTQVKWSAVGIKKSSVYEIIENYADQIIALVPLLTDYTDSLAQKCFECRGLFEEVLEHFNDAAALASLFDQTKQRMEAFEKENLPSAELINQKLNAVVNYISQKLLPTTSEKALWSACRLEQCLNNDKFIDGTIASVRNAGILFSFVSANIKRSREIISSAKAESSAEMVFVMDGQSEIWRITNEVSKQFNQRLTDFTYKHPPVIKSHS